MSRLFNFLRKNKEEKRKLHVPDFKEYYKVVAKILYAYDIKEMYEDQSNMPGLCPSCRCKIEMVPDLNYKPNKRKADVYITFPDGFYIVSDNFKRFCDLNNYENLKFLKLHSSRYYYFEPLSKIKTNIYWPQVTKLGNWCNICKTYSFVCGCTLIDESVDNNFIMREDLFTCSLHEKSPLTIIGLETAKKMIDFGLKGIYFDDVWGLKDL